MLNGKVFTFNLKKDKNSYTLRDIIIPEKDVSVTYFSKLKYQKTLKKSGIPEVLKNKNIVNGFTYNWSEGGMSETDSLDKRL